ncbi:hypothetical protein MMC07_005319 [Pseudocyphellaria aurata]|nr:hypothetical protein [Pseudocyphellaria aurata]
MAHSPVTKVIYPPFKRAALQSFRNDIIIYGRQLDEGDSGNELPRILIDDVSMLVDYAEFLEDKLQAKIRDHSRELEKWAKEYNELKSEHDTYKSKMAVEHLPSADAESEKENNDPKDQKSANPRKRDRENDESTDKTDEKRSILEAKVREWEEAKGRRLKIAEVRHSNPDSVATLSSQATEVWWQLWTAEVRRLYNIPKRALGCDMRKASYTALLGNGDSS